jgi:hypothetical protein
MDEEPGNSSDFWNNEILILRIMKIPLRNATPDIVELLAKYP